MDICTLIDSSALWIGLVLFLIGILQLRRTFKQKRLSGSNSPNLIIGGDNRGEFGKFKRIVNSSTLIFTITYDWLSLSVTLIGLFLTLSGFVCR
ncbi:hypothetical protein ES705_18563 [subsurface metagenome]